MIQIPHSSARNHNRTLFFKYTSASVAKIIFTNRTLRWSSPILFNDPFDVHRELGPKPVKYSAELPLLATAEGWSKSLRQSVMPDQINVFKEYCYLKTTDWKTEQEWRVVSFARELETGLYSDWHFAPLTLSEVVFGHQIDEQDRLDILAMLSHDFGHVRAFDAVLGSGNKFDFQEILGSHFVNVLKDESKLVCNS